MAYQFSPAGQRGNQATTQPARTNLYPTVLSRPGGGPLYPSVGQPPIAQPVVGPPARAPPPTFSSSSSFPAAGIRVVLKSEYQMAPAVQLAPNHTDIPRSTFQFDFGFERQVIQEMEAGLSGRRVQQQDFARLNGAGPSQPAPPPQPPPTQPADDPVVRKYMRAGFTRDAVVLALSTYGDVQNKVVEFCASYGTLKEMGFPAEKITGALSIYDNDLEKSLSHLTRS